MSKSQAHDAAKNVSNIMRCTYVCIQISLTLLEIIKLCIALMDSENFVTVFFETSKVLDLSAMIWFLFQRNIELSLARGGCIFKKLSKKYQKRD